MKSTKIGLTAVSVAAASSLVLAGCAMDGGSGLQEGTSVTVAWNQPFYSYNSGTSYGNATANANIIYMTLSSFNYYNNTPELVKDTSFGSYELVSEDPLTVKYTLSDKAKWSDGTPVDAADLLLNWAAGSRALDTPEFDPNDFIDPDTGEFTDAFPKDVVYFDTGATPDFGLGLVSQVPEISDDMKSITLVYDAPFVDWELSFGAPLPAHVVAANALGIADPEEAKAAVVDAIQNKDAAALAPLSSFWNSGFNFTELPEDPSLYLSSGPYVIKDFVADQYITLVANLEYEGDNKPTIEEVTVRFIPDPLAAVQALENGEVDVISPQATADIKSALDAIEGINVITGVEGTYEHVDLQFEEGANDTFSDPLVREAFMKVIPRNEIVEKLIKPIIGDSAVVRNSQIFVPGAEGYDESVANNGSENYADVDIEGAKALLAEAGKPNPTVCFLYAKSNPRRVNEFALIQASAAQAGFDVQDCGNDKWGGLLGTPGAYDAVLFGWQSTSLGVTNSLPTFQTGGINNLNFFSDPKVDEIVEALGTEFDKEKQIELQIELDKAIWDAYYGITIFQFPGVTAHSTRVEGVDPSILSPTIFWNIWDWSIVEES